MRDIIDWMKIVKLEPDNLESAINNAKHGNKSTLDELRQNGGAKAVAYDSGAYHPSSMYHKLHRPSILVTTENGYYWVPIEAKAKGFASKNLPQKYCNGCYFAEMYAMHDIGALD